MAQQTMYAGQVNSPQTELAAAIDSTQTTITVLDGSVLPAAPNLLVIGGDEDAETVLYTGKSGNSISGVTRGFQGAAKAWGAGVKVGRFFTAYDYEALRGNISDHETRVTTAQSTANNAVSAAGTAQATADNAASAASAAQGTANSAVSAAAAAQSTANAAIPKSDISTSTSSTSTTTVAASSAVKAAYDLAAAALPKSGGTMTNDIMWSNGTRIRDVPTATFIFASNNHFEVITEDGGTAIFEVDSSGTIKFLGYNVITSAGGQTINGKTIVVKTDSGGINNGPLAISGGQDVRMSVNTTTAISGTNNVGGIDFVNNGSFFGGMYVKGNGGINFYTASDGANARVTIGDDGRLYIGSNVAWHAGNQGDPSTLSTTSKQIVGAINELFQSASNGKSDIAAAITGKGIPASGSDTFAQLAAKIGQLTSYATGTGTISGASYTLSVTGLGFKPKLVYCYAWNGDAFLRIYDEVITAGNTTLFRGSTSPISVSNFTIANDGFSCNWAATVNNQTATWLAYG